MGRAFSNSFLAGDSAARAFLPLDFREPRDRAARARQAAAQRVSPTVLDALAELNGRLPPSAARAANLEALRAGDTAVVVTGQQVGLFLGPLYAFYKAASAIACARRLQQETGVRCVPLFWLQTEDHDFAEIASSTVAGAAGAPVVLSLEGASGDDRRSVAQRRLGPEVDGLLARLAGELPPGAAADETLALLRAHYRPGRGLADAFAGVMASLFADEGLLFLDPRDARVAAAAAPLFREALAGAGALEAALGARREALAAAGFDEQIGVRADCALVFFHRGGAEGPRFRLQRAEAGGWRLSGADEAVSDADVAAALARAPLSFSTSALLRPIVQDALLPTAAYVGGPAEVSYFAQLPPVYEHFGVAAPLVVPRARFRCIDARARRLLEELGLAPDDLARPTDELLARLPARAPAGAPTPEAVRARVAADIAPAVESLAREVAAVDPQLARAAERTRASVAHALDRLAARYERTLATRDGVALERLRRLQAALAPGGAPQERVYGWPSLAGRHGPAALTRLVFEALDRAEPFPARVLELAP